MITELFFHWQEKIGKIYTYKVNSDKNYLHHIHDRNLLAEYILREKLPARHYN